MGINLENISYNKIKEDLYNYLRSLDNWNDIEENIDASTLDMLLSLISTFGTYETYKYRAWRKENYIQEAQLDSSIIRLARLLGYRLNRLSAPRIKVKLNTEETLLFSDGMVFGKLNDYDIIYFGPTKKFENGDELDLYIGKYNYIEDVVNSDYILKTLTPMELKAIDNNAVHVFVNDVLKPISHNIEDYVIFRYPVDYSIDFNTTNIFVMDRNNYYGLDLNNNDAIKYTWIETDGKLDFKLTDCIIDDKFIPLEISSYGTDGDDIEKIRFLAPLYFSALRRMVTKEDHEYIIKAHELIKDCAVRQVEDKPYISHLYPDSNHIQNETYTITILGTTYTVTSDSSDTYQTVLDKLYNELINDNNISVTRENDYLEITQTNFDVCEFDITVSDNLINSVIQIFEKAPCCTLDCFYIKYNVTDDPIMLSGSEQLELAEYIKHYKLVGTRIILQPALKEEHTIDLKVSLINGSYQQQTLDKINEIISDYELKLNKPFYYGELLAKISQIIIFDESINEYIKTVDYIIPNQPIFDLPARVDTYYKFTVNIEFMEPGE